MILEAPTEAECYLYSIITDKSGVDLMEFCVTDGEQPDRIFRCWDFQVCFAGETEVLTKAGPVPIKDLVGTVDLLTTSRRWVESEVKSFGVQPIVELELERYGVRKIIRTTANHRWFIGDKNKRHVKEKTTMQLTPGNFLESMYPRRLSGMKIVPYGVAHGVCWGDGTFSGGSVDLVLWGEKLECLSKFFVGEGILQNRPDVAQIGRRWYFLPSYYKTPVNLNESASYLYSWLAGYFAADGAVAPDGTCVISSVNRSSIELVKNVCIKVGIAVGTITEQYLEESSGYASGPTRVFKITLNSSDLRDEFFLKDSHRVHWNNGRGGYSPRRWKVVEVRKTDCWEEVFCAEVPESHCFTLDDYILTGNCWWRNSSQRQIDLAGRCVAEGTLITTQDGDVPIESLVDQTPVILALDADHNVDFYPAERVWASGDKECLTISSYRNSTTVSVDHRLWTPGGWKHASDIVPGTSIRTVDGWDVVRKVEHAGIRPTYEVTMVGHWAYISDGYFSHNSVGKTQSIAARAIAFPFNYAGQEMVITAPEGIHLDAVTDKVETYFLNNRLLNHMLRDKSAVKHRPFHCNFSNSARIMGRIPHFDGSGIKGCVESETLILSERGLVAAKDIRIGDRVLGKAGWTTVERVEEFEDDGYEISGEGPCSQIVNDRHRFWGVKNLEKSPKRKRRFSDPHWFMMDDVERQFWATIRKLPDGEVSVSTDEAWLLGLYAADGHLVNENGVRWRVCYSIHPSNQDTFREIAERLGLHVGTTTRSHSTADMLTICNKNLAMKALECGRRSSNKQVPAFILFSNYEVRKAFFEGYMYGDGTFDKRGRIQSSSASRKMSTGIALIAQSLGYTVSCSVFQPKVTEINGVKLKNKPQLSWRVTVTSKSRAYLDNDYAYYRIKDIVSVGVKTFVNIVTSDHTFVSEMSVSHNTHPILLEMDEAQNYPDPAGWVEIIETMKMGSDGGIWRCIAEDQLVLSNRGYIKIQDIVIGDLVWTHRNRWKRVSNTWDNGVRECIKVKGQGHPGLKVTPDHKFMALGPDKNLTWRSAVDVQYWASTCKMTTDIPIPQMVRLPKTKVLVPDVSDPRWLWLYGLYIAEGYGCDFRHQNRNHRRSHWCVNDEECDEVAERLREFGAKPQFYKQGHSVKVVVNNGPMHFWLAENAGKLATEKRIAEWVFDLSPEGKQAVLDGMLYGDGSWDSKRTRWEYATVSKELVFQLKLLAQSLSYVCNIREVAPKTTEIDGRTIYSKVTYVAQIRHIDEYVSPHTHFIDGYVWSPVPKTESCGLRRVYDLEVEDDHSYVVEGIIVHNCHGVTTGARNHFWKFTQPDSGWSINRIVAMARPNWTDEERQAKIKMYGGKDSHDYRRNVLGLHGDAQVALFVYSRLCRSVDMKEDSDYNTKVYNLQKITNGMINDYGSILNVLDVPGSHRNYSKTWIGMDVGYVGDPSEIVVFAEEDRGSKPSLLRLISRFSMKNVAHQDQVDAILWIMGFYQPQIFAMDSTGVGLPLYQSIQHQAEKDVQIAGLFKRIKGYNFSSKVLMGIDDSIEVDEILGDKVAEAGIRRNVLEASTDVLRDLIDSERIALPYDNDLFNQFQGQTYTNVKSTMDMYGRTKRSFSKGEFHALDACRMAALGWQQETEVKEISKPKQVPSTRPIFMFA